MRRGVHPTNRLAASSQLTVSPHADSLYPRPSPRPLLSLRELLGPLPLREERLSETSLGQLPGVGLLSEGALPHWDLLSQGVLPLRNLLAPQALGEELARAAGRGLATQEGERVGERLALSLELTVREKRGGEDCRIPNSQREG